MRDGNDCLHLPGPPQTRLAGREIFTLMLSIGKQEKI
jgi:hypothetical protein